MSAMTATSSEDLELVWAGDYKMEKPFYVRIQGKTFVFELACSENNASYYHAVWTNR